MERKIYTSGPLWEKLKPLARENRHEPTLAEEKLWICLRNKGLRELNSGGSIQSPNSS